MNRLKLVVVVSAVLALAGVVAAALIGVSNYVSTSVPHTLFQNLKDGSTGALSPAAVTYDPSTQLLTISATPSKTDFLGGGTGNRNFVPSPAGTVQIQIKVTQANGSAWASNGLVEDFKMTGIIDTNGSNSADPSDLGFSDPNHVLLTGTIVQLGFANVSGASSSNPDLLDFRFAVTGGAMAPQFAGKDIGVLVRMEADNWPSGAAFGVSFRGNTKGDVVPIPCGGAIGDFVWNDLNQDGIQDPGELGLNGITVNLYDASGLNLLSSVATTNNPMGGAPGYYQFPNLCAGTYKVSVNQSTVPVGFYASPPSQGGDPVVDSNPSPATVTLASAATDQTVDFGFYACTGTIGDFVWHDLNRDGIQDVGEPGMDGVVVNLLDGSGTTVLQTTTTANGGQYSFGGVCHGDYQVQVDASTLPGGFTPTDSNATGSTNDSNGSPASVNLPTDSSTNSTIDFGYLNPCTGAIGDYVWHDANQNGLQDAGEVGIDGVIVELLDSQGNSFNPIRTATTGVNPNDTTKHGYYAITGLCAATYKVRVVAGSVPPQFTAPTTPNVGSDVSIDSNASPATVILSTDSSTSDTIDFGYISACSGSIGNFVWHDLDHDGIQDAGEVGFAGVTVTLKKASDNSVVGTSTTGSDGLYLFSGLCPADYIVEATPPLGAIASPTLQGGNTAVDSNLNPDTVNLPLDNSSNLTIDFGFYKLASIGDFVWDDLNANGQQDSGEPGIAGVSVTLQACDGTQIGSPTTTDVNGLYSFTNLVPDCYKVKFDLPAGYTNRSPLNAGADETDSDADTTTGITGNYTLGSGENNTSVDAGFYKLASIGDFVWEDLNGNGLQDGGEAGISGATVNLLDGGNAVVATTTTNGSGLYSFTGLTPGSYKVQFVTPSGGYTPSPANAGNDAIDSDPIAGVTGSFTLISGENNDTLDAGFYKKASIGDYVWRDLNNNGVQDEAASFGINGITVTLFTGAGVQVGSPTITANNSGNPGYYQFTNLDPGSYYVVFTVASGEVFTTPFVGSTATDSNADATGKSDTFTLVSGDTNNTIDAGLRPIDLSLTKTVNNPSPNVGSNVIFTITVSNALGMSTATGVTVTDVLPTGLTYVSDDGGGAYVSGTGIWTVGTLAAGASQTLHITATVTEIGAKTNTAEVATANQTTDADSTPNNQVEGEDDQASATLVAQQIDLSVNKTVDNATPNVGTDVTFTITVSNASGMSTATGVHVQDPVPAGMTIQGTPTASQGTYTPATGDWNVGTLATGASATLTITAKVDNADAKNNWAEVSAADQPDVDSQPNNDADHTVRHNQDDDDNAVLTPQQIDLSLTKTVNNATPNLGSNVVFTITVSNAAGMSTATGVHVQDLLPAGLTIVAPAPVASQGTYTPGTGDWNVGSLASPGSATLTITASVDSTGVKNNAAQVSAADQPDVDSQPNNDIAPTVPHNQDDDDNVTVTPQQIDLSLTKTVNNATPNLGSNVVFTITVSNATGFSSATGVHVQDLLPAGLTIVAPAPVASQGTYTPGTGDWNVGSLASPGSATLTITASVITTGVKNNAAQVSAADQPDVDSQPNNDIAPTVPHNQDDDDNVTVTPQQIDLSVTKTVNTGTVTTGSNVTFTVTVSNAAGFSTATGVTVGDLLPAGLSYVSSTASQGSYASGTGIWTVGTLLSPASATLTITATVTTVGAKTNTAEVTAAGQPDVDSTPNNHVAAEDDQASVTVTGQGVTTLAQCVAGTGDGSATTSRDNLGYPFSSSVARTSVLFNESEVLRAYGRSAKSGGIDTLDLWANDENSVILGARTAAYPTVSNTNPPMTSAQIPAHVVNPIVGDTSVTDPSARPIYPAIFVTDITGLSDNATFTDPTYRAGDWQFGGTPVAVQEIFGNWKGASAVLSGGLWTLTVDAKPVKTNNWDLGPGSDTPVGGFAALTNEGYGTEARWNINDSNILVTTPLPGGGTKLTAGMIPGHKYRIQVMVHDGDQNNSGGDVGEGCVILENANAQPLTTARLGDTVWSDSNGNGVQDAGEPGIAGVTVSLSGPSGPQNATTDKNGHYLFSNLSPGSYSVQFATPSGYTPSPANVGSDDTIDSDAVSGTAGPYSLLADDVNLTADAGFIPPPMQKTSSVFSGKELQITLANIGAADLQITGFQLTWPNATNGKLNSLKLGSVVIYNTPANGPSLTLSSAQLAAASSSAARTVTHGTSAVLHIIFQNNVNTTPANYSGGLLTFSNGQTIVIP